MQQLRLGGEVLLDRQYTSLDLFRTSCQGQMPVLSKNLGSRSFKDVTSATGAGDGSFPCVNWATGLADFDNDGDRASRCEESRERTELTRRGSRRRAA